jgi:diguanylate cyclase (GGDEF)-like protein
VIALRAIAGSAALPLAWVVGLFAVLRWPDARPHIERLPHIAPLVGVIVASGVAVRFRRPRLLFALAAIVGVFMAARPAPSGVAATLVLALGALGATAERSLLSAATVWRAVVAAVPLALLLWRPEWAAALGGALDAAVAETLPRRVLGLPRAVAATSLASAAVLFYGLARRKGAADAAMLGLLAIALAAVRAGSRQGLSDACLLGAAGLVVVTVLQESYRMAWIDGLTRLPGRRALDEELAGLGSRYAIAMVDIDHFKKINDRHGHPVGDQVLRMVASRLRQSARGAAAFRYGGEEFTLLYRRTDPDAVFDALGEVREAIAASPFQIRGVGRPKARTAGRARRGKGGGGGGLKVTVSIGLAGPTDARRSPSEVIAAADKALYKAKRAGRNRVVQA